MKTDLDVQKRKKTSSERELNKIFKRNKSRIMLPLVKIEAQVNTLCLLVQPQNYH